MDRHRPSPSIRSALRLVRRCQAIFEERYQSRGKRSQARRLWSPIICNALLSQLTPLLDLSCYQIRSWSDAGLMYTSQIQRGLVVVVARRRPSTCVSTDGVSTSAHNLLHFVHFFPSCYVLVRVSIFSRTCSGPQIDDTVTWRLARGPKIYENVTLDIYTGFGRHSLSQTSRGPGSMLFPLL